jgi:hypothetical protein
MLPYSHIHNSSAPPAYDSSAPSSSHSSSSSPSTRSAHLASLDLLDPPGGGGGGSDLVSRPSTDSLPYSDSYDSAGEGTSSLASSVRSRLGGPSTAGSSKDLHAYGVSAAWSDGEGYGGGMGGGGGAHFYPGSSRVSSRTNSPAPAHDGFDGYLSYRTTSRNRSRATSGYATPSTPQDKELYGPECAFSRLFSSTLQKAETPLTCFRLLLQTTSNITTKPPLCYGTSAGL